MKLDDDFWIYVVHRTGERKAALLYEHYKEGCYFHKSAIIAFIVASVFGFMCITFALLKTCSQLCGCLAFVTLVAVAVFLFFVFLEIGHDMTLYATQLDNLKWGYDYENRTRPNYIDKLLNYDHRTTAIREASAERKD